MNQNEIRTVDPMANDPLFAVLKKVEKVYLSCKTPEQYITAHQYCTQARKHFKASNAPNHYLVVLTSMRYLKTMDQVLDATQRIDNRE